MSRRAPTRSVATRLRRDESGAILVISVICLVVLLGITALVVDIGIAFSQRRTMQSSADASALGGAQDLASGDTVSAVANAELVGQKNIPKRTLNWNACPPETLPAGFKVVPGTSCISIGGGFQRLRVRIPRQTFPSVFGKILGFSSTSTSTVAIAGLKSVGNGGGLEPFAIGSAFGSGDYCLDSGARGASAASCAGGTTGNYGLLSFAWCNVNSSLADDIAAGADHLYVANPLVNGTYKPDVADDCTQPGPNTVASSQGNKVGQETPALLTGSGPYPNPGGPARLQRIPTNCGAFFPSWEAVSTSCGSAGAIDNRPLWEFIPEGNLPGIPPSCQRQVFDQAVVALSGSPLEQSTLHTMLQTCITDYASNPAYTAPVFSAETGGVVDQGLALYDIQESPRFVYVPQVRETTPLPGNSGTYHIQQFRAVFIQRTGANNSPSFFEPGPWNNGLLPDSATADVTGFVLPPPRTGCTPTDTDSCGTMLPGLLGAIGPSPIVIGANAVVELFG